MSTSDPPLLLCLQPAAILHRYVRTPNAAHIYERPERVRAVMLGVARAVAGLEELREAEAEQKRKPEPVHQDQSGHKEGTPAQQASTDIDQLLSSLSIQSSSDASAPSTSRDRTKPSPFVHLPAVPTPLTTPGDILLNHPAVRVTHATEDVNMPLVGYGTRWRARRDRRSSLQQVVQGKADMSDQSVSTLAVAQPAANSLGPAPLANGPTAPAQALPDSSYLPSLLGWARDAPTRIKETGCEFPPDSGLHAGDLYLGPGSILAIEGCIQTVCQAVDAVCEANEAVQTGGVDPVNAAATCGAPESSKAFCVIRPPGHHCGEDTPSGFCYINNVVVAAMHAYIEHDYDRAVILDFDLHHGNGTQSIVMSLNEASRREELLRQGGKPLHAMSEEERESKRQKRPWMGFYGSLHDIYSFPCEDGDVDLLKDASISLASHGQYIENIHLQPYTSEEDFHSRLYPRYERVLRSAEHYLEATQADPARTLVLISAGFDACEYEHQAMQRHDRRVPPSFFSRFTADIRAFADRHANGRLVSMLEGGYSDRALATGTMSHVHGLFSGSAAWHGLDWWKEQNVAQLEKATRRKRNGRLAPYPPDAPREPSLLRTHALLDIFDTHGTSDRPDTPARATVIAEQPRRTLRERKKPAAFDEVATTPPARSAASRPKAKSTANTPIHQAAAPKVPSTVDRPARGTPATPTPDSLADALDASMQRMTLQKASATPRQPTTPLRAVHVAADTDSPSLHIISAMRKEAAAATAPSPAHLEADGAAAPPNSALVAQSVTDTPRREQQVTPPALSVGSDTEAIAESTALLPAAPPPTSAADPGPAAAPPIAGLTAEQHKIFLKFARPKIEPSDAQSEQSDP